MKKTIIHIAIIFFLIALASSCKKETTTPNNNNPNVYYDYTVWTDDTTWTKTPGNTVKVAIDPDGYNYATIYGNITPPVNCSGSSYATDCFTSGDMTICHNSTHTAVSFHLHPGQHTLHAMEWPSTGKAWDKTFDNTNDSCHVLRLNQ